MGAERPTPGHSLGVHRVMGDEKILPQAASKLDNSLPIFSNELLINVEVLNIDAASFVQMESITGGDPAKIGELILENCRTQGKQQNPVTGSGGMLVGTVAQVGSKFNGTFSAPVGSRVATLVSLTLTPLSVTKIKKVDMKTHQVEVEGYAILFESGVAASLPQDIPEPIVMALFDVAGAPAWTNSLCGPGQTTVVLGAGGKAGVLSCVAGREAVGEKGKVIAIEPNPKAAAELASLGVCDQILELDASDPLAVHSGIKSATHGRMGDVVINVVSTPNTEMSSVLCAKESGRVLFFGMATSFSKVALGAEGVASAASLCIGNGYFPGHADYAVELVRRNTKLKNLFYNRYQ